MARLRLFTRPPLPPFPERRVPLFLRRIALATVLPAAFPYLRPDFFAVIVISWGRGGLTPRFRWMACW